MTLALIVYKSLRQHALATLITALSIALAGGLLMAVWMVKAQSQETFTRVNGGFDAVLGARGSKLQLILNAIFHLETSPGNLAWSDFIQIQKDPSVEHAIPIAVGDNYRGYRLVGTLPTILTDIAYAPDKRHLLAAGRIFDPNYREAVLGSFAAQKLRLMPGDTFHPFHGLTFDEQKEHAETYTVVGILKPSNTPSDRVIWIPLEGLQKMSGHNPATETDLSAVLIRFKAGSPQAGFRLDQVYNKQGNQLTLAWPIGGIMAELLDKFAWFERTLALIAYLVATVATGSVLASIYNTMNERRREFAILRALGARRQTVFATIVLEAGSIGMVGALLAFIIYAIILILVAQVIRRQTGVVIEPFVWHPILVLAPAGLTVLSALAGMVPAVKAYKTDVAEHLAPMS